MFAFANPKRFMDLSTVFLPWLAVATVILLGAGVVLGLLAPPDYQQGDTVKIMFLHVPAAWTAMMAYGLLAVTSLFSLVWRHPLWDVAAKAAAPLGAVFTLLGLITGSLWGRPMWGAYWVWDARLTSFLLLLFLYLGHMALLNAFDDKARGRRSAALLAIVGLINLPIIKFSVDWWNTWHQPASILRMGGPSIDPSMLRPLLVMAVSVQLYFLLVTFMRMKAMLLEARRQTALHRRAPRSQAMPRQSAESGRA